jgi:two-component system chemotaxis response regulator CheB
MAPSPIKVLIVDDSALVREFLRRIISSQRDMTVVASAPDPFVARDKYLKTTPDVIILDIEMPRMDGLTFLKKLMASHPTPVVMFSNRTQRGADATLDALRLGAVDFLAKPAAGGGGTLEDAADELVAKIRAAAAAKVRRQQTNLSQELKVPEKVEVDQVVALTKTPPRPGGPMVILIGASTGGTVALEQVLTRLPANSPPIAIVQHMPENFTEPFATRLNQQSKITVSEARDMQPLPAGHAVIAPGGRHMLLESDGSGYRVRVKQGPPVNRHRPSVDVLFRSGVNSAGPNTVAVIMTGMGDDGAKGMKDLHDAGALTIAQNEETCTVYGMPKVAVQMGAVDRVVPLERISPLIIGLWSQNRGRAFK